MPNTDHRASYRFAVFATLLSTLFHPIVNVGLGSLNGGGVFSLSAMAQVIWPETLVFGVILAVISIGSTAVIRRVTRKEEA